jgi:biotin synthase-related radical SAM superfamily protein
MIHFLSRSKKKLRRLNEIKRNLEKNFVMKNLCSDFPAQDFLLPKENTKLNKVKNRFNKLGAFIPTSLSEWNYNDFARDRRKLSSPTLKNDSFPKI